MSKQSRTKSTTIVGDLTQKVKKVKKPSRQSAWFLTINTNKRFEDDDPELQETGVLVAEAMDSYFNNKDKLMKGIVWRSKVHDFDDARSYFELERSPKTQCLHAHGILNIIHHSNIHLGSAKLQKQLCDEMNLKGLNTKGCYVHFDFIRDWDSKAWNKERMHDYIGKNRKFDMKKPSKKSQKKEQEEEEKKKQAKISKMSAKIDEQTDLFEDDEEPEEPEEESEESDDLEDESEDDSDTEEEEMEEEPVKPQPKPKAAPKPQPKPTPKRKIIESDDSDDEPEPVPKRTTKKSKSGIPFVPMSMPSFKKKEI
jgi:hypothetical protein